MPLIRVGIGETVPLSPDVLEALVEELAQALVADYQANAPVTVDSPGGTDSPPAERLSVSGTSLPWATS